MSVTEAHLWAAAEFRSEAMIERMVRQFQRPFIAFAFRKIGDWQIAEDLTQETFLRAWMHTHTVRNEGENLQSWLFMILRNIIIDLMRKKRLECVSLDELMLVNSASGDNMTYSAWHRDPSPGPQELLETKWRSGVLSAAVERLPLDYRVAVRGNIYDDLTYREVASREQIPEGTVKSRLNYSKHRLKKLLADEGFGADDLLH